MISIILILPLIKVYLINIVEYVKKSQDKVLYLQKQYAEYRILQVRNQELNVKYEEALIQHKRAKDNLDVVIKELEEEVRKKKAIIMDYDSKLEDMEEQIQNILNEKLTIRFKLEYKLAEAQKQISQLIRKNEALLIWNQKESLMMNEKKKEWKKDVEIIRRSISCINKEKSELRHKLEEKEVKIKLKQYKHQAVQVKNDEAKLRETLQIELNKIKEHNNNLQLYASKANEEMNKITKKALEVSNKNLELNDLLNKKEGELVLANKTIIELQLESKALKKKRERTISEIRQLTHKLSLSYCSGKRIIEAEKLLIIVKNQLEVIYKEFISCVFNEDIREIKELAGRIDLKVNNLIERLTDYHEDYIEPHKPFSLIAKKTGSRVKEDVIMLTPIKTINDSTTIKIEENFNADDIILYNSCEMAKNKLFNQSLIRRNSAISEHNITEFT